jgi:INO80 complex subunit C
MAPALADDAEVHSALISKLDMNHVSKPFRNPNWKPSQRRNKNIKTILGDTIRKEISLAATVDNSGTQTPLAADDTEASGLSSATETLNTAGRAPNLFQASANLSKLVLERNAKAGMAVGTGNGDGAGFVGVTPGATYTNIESAPSLAHVKKYCDMTGLPAPYTDPKTRLRYFDKEVFGVIRSFGPGVAEQYLEARGAHTVLK